MRKVWSGLTRPQKLWAKMVGASLLVLVAVNLTPVFHATTHYNKEFGLDLHTGIHLEKVEDGPLNGIALYAQSAKGLTHLYNQLNYDLESVRKGLKDIPRVYLAAVPNDFKKIHDVRLRKKLFIQSALPLILRTNNHIIQQRTRLTGLKQQKELGLPISADDEKWLDKLARSYGLKTLNLKELLARVDVIPVSLALSQAIEESGWGMSRFAQQGNALFGQQAFTTGSGGLAPDRADIFRRVRQYKSLMQSVESYARNLNTHAAYQSFRQRRAGLRANNLALTSDALIHTMAQYSQRREDYVKNLKNLIETNRLQEFDRAKLISAERTFTVARAGF